MTRAISIASPPEEVWPWLAQLGRGAGWYSIDRLDNGNRMSARHLVSWIPPAQVGDASAVGYLRRLKPGSGITWWLPGERFLGATVRMVFDMHLAAEDGGSRLVARVSGDAAGRNAVPVLRLFEVIDSIMAREQLLGIKRRVENVGASPTAGDPQESGARDQYQLYEVIYASGQGAGVPGREKAARWFRAAIEDGVLEVQASGETL